MVSASKNSHRVAIIGAETLLGREVEDVLGTSRVTAFAASGEGTFADQEGEAVFVQPFDAAALAEHAFIVLAGAPEGARKAYDLAKVAKQKPLLIDCVGDLENQPEAQISAAFFEEARTVNDSGKRGWLQVPAHAAAQTIALPLSRLSAMAPVRQSLAHIFEPASERGRKGIAELQSQTTNLLSFKALHKTIYDAQVAFNLLPQLGEDAPLKLANVEQRIERHLATLLSRQPGLSLTMPSLRVIQVPVFHGYSISLWAEFDRNISSSEVSEALACAQIEIRAQDQEPPDAVGAAGQNGLIAGDIRTDRNNGRAVWIWLVADNLRLMAESAAAILSGGAAR